MPFIYLNYIYSTIFNILLIFISIYNAPYHKAERYMHIAPFRNGTLSKNARDRRGNALDGSTLRLVTSYLRQVRGGGHLSIQMGTYLPKSGTTAKRCLTGKS